VAFALSKRLATAGALALLALPVRALDGQRLVTQHLITNWQAQQGLPQNGVAALARTPDGYLWVGTQDGLARFDGVSFTVFDRANTTALRHSMIACLRVDRAGRLWIGTRRGLVSYAGGVFSPYGPESGLPDDRVSSLSEDRGGRLFVGTLGAGLFRREGERFVPVGGLTGKRIRALAEDGAGAIWVASEAGLGRITAEGVTNLTVRDGLAGDNGFDVLVDREGRLWFGAEGGLSRRRDDGGFDRFGAPEGLANTRIRVMAEDREGNLWIGTEDGGLARLTGGRFSALARRNGFPSDSIGALLPDAEGTLWVGTNDGGLVRMIDGPLTTFGEREGLPMDVASTMTEARDGALWIGTFGGVVRLDPSGALRTWSTRNGLASDRVTGVAEDASGRMWIGTYGGGLASLDGDRVHPVRRQDGLPSDNVDALLPARAGGLWIGFGGGGLARRDASGRLTRWSRSDGLPDDYVQALYEDREGALWVGMANGLARLREGRFESWTTATGLPAPSILSFAEGPDGALWMGTAGDGLIRFEGGRFHQLTTRDGLPNDGIFAILTDDAGGVWMSSNRGIFRTAFAALDAAVRGERLAPTLFGVEDGMRSAEGYGGTQPCGARTRDGRLLFAGIRGLVTADPRWRPPTAPPPPVHVEGVQAAVRVERAADGVRLGAGARAVEIRYAALGLRAPERLRFRYLLEGYDADWVEAGSRRVAYYPRLPGGRYVFRVATADAQDGGTEAHEAIDVAPAWHERWSVRCLFVALATALLLGVHRLRTWRLRLRQRELQRQVDDQTVALRAANESLERLASVDGLTGIANRRTFDETLAREWLDHRRRGAPLALVLGDVDHFKAFNDACGHPAGDDVLRQVAGVLAGGGRRATDLPARYGGEEFALLMRDTTASGALAMAREILDALRARGIPHPRSSAAAHVTLSLGVAARVPSVGLEPADLLRAADAALYRAKAEGRDRAVEG
jgi:diguanylate cyclase (GGDEF)-like protein